MDRNIPIETSKVNKKVATREGGVDRNPYQHLLGKRRIVVATREGGVDRNLGAALEVVGLLRRHPRGWRG